MIIKEVNGNLLTMFAEGDFDLIIHQCNCMNNMGAGIAAAIANSFPAAKKADDRTVLGDINKLGTYSVAKVEEGYIVNLYSQYHYGFQHGTSPTSYKSMQFALAELATILKSSKMHEVKIGTYQLGCNRGGADWTKVKKIINETLKDFDVTIVS